jgi:hypothetical protein
LFENPELHGQFLRTGACAYYGGANLGKRFSTARRITDGDLQNWYSEWNATADRVSAAEDSRAKGHVVSAREAFLRASTYYRASLLSLMFTPPVDPRMVAALAKQV